MLALRYKLGKLDFGGEQPFGGLEVLQLKGDTAIQLCAEAYMHNVTSSTRGPSYAGGEKLATIFKWLYAAAGASVLDSHRRYGVAFTGELGQSDGVGLVVGKQDVVLNEAESVRGIVLLPYGAVA